MRNTVFIFEKNGQRVVYLAKRHRRKANKRENRPIEGDIEYKRALNHRCLVRQVLWNCAVSTYNPEMDFTNALNKGWNLIYSNDELIYKQKQFLTSK